MAFKDIPVPGISYLVYYEYVMQSVWLQLKEVGSAYNWQSVCASIAPTVNWNPVLTYKF